jgi:2-keto-4-pentenoate hydratase/2-oxohepta-3-ene-1,7-dioic acid hydratase in catechol pathway
MVRRVLMRIARVRTQDDKIRYGIVEDDSIALIEGDIYGDWKKSKQVFSLDDVTLLAPVEPPNVIAIGLNYRDHAKEGGADAPSAPVIFLKANTSVTGPQSHIVLPKMAAEEVDYEAELVVIIGKTAKNVSKDDAHEYILGYTCGNDVSARDCQMKLDQQWARGKSFDTFAPLGPWIETELDPDNCDISLRLNGEVMQQSNTSFMIFNVANLVSYLSRCMTLLPATAIMTGTPAGVGFARKPPAFLRSGDEVEVAIEGIGALKNTVILE